jgi:diazepam-binding inhibitor (GABA receptor modulator, acyl-CoA-binding protein)
MEISEQFEKAVSQSKGLSQRPDNESLLQLYALYKQASAGDVTAERPGGFDFAAIAKYDAWAEKKGISREQAMKDYVALVETLQQKYG